MYRGRYFNLKAEDRRCNVCNVIEDKIHTLCLCYKFLVLREQMYQAIVKTENYIILKAFLSLYGLMMKIELCGSIHFKVKV